MKRICVFCSASESIDERYRSAAVELGAELVKRNYNLVFGASYCGLMKVIADTVKENGGKVCGVGLEAFNRVISNDFDYDELHIAKNFSERKSVMYEKSDAFITLPGGIGTYEEYFSTYSANNISKTPKPSGLLNICNFYDPIIEQINNGYKLGFISQKKFEFFTFDSQVSSLLDKIEKTWN